MRDKLKHYEDARIPEIMPEGLQTIDRAIGTYGKDAQLTKAVEEMSELTKALCKLKVCKLKYDTPFNRETQEVYSNIEEETADVFIMLVQLFVIFNPHELVNITKIVWDKLDRLKDNLDKEAAKQQSRRGAKMIHQNVDLYICEHCRLEFYDEEECLEHEKTHSPHFDGSTNEDIAKELDALGANACSFRVGDCVMGMTVHSFKNLMSVAARALRGGADNAGKE